MPPSRSTANGSTAGSVASPAHAPAPARPPQFTPGATSRQLKESNSMIFMMRAIYHYLSQFGFEDLAASVRTALGTRFHPNPLNDQDQSESELRCSMYRTFTLTSATTPNFQDSAEIVLDDINTLLIAAHMPRTVGSSVFRLECEVRIAAVMCVIEQPAQLYQEVIDQFYTEEIICTQEQADRIDKKIAAGQTCSDIELRKHHLFYQRLHLIDYRKEKAAVQKLDKKSPTRRHAEQEVAKFEAAHSRQLLQQSVTTFLQEILQRTKVSGAVFLEHLITYLMTHKEVYIGPDGRQDEPLSESEAEEEEEEEEEEAAVEEEDEDEEMADQSPQPAFVAPPAQKRPVRSVKDGSEMEDDNVPTRRAAAAVASPKVVVSTPSARSAKTAAASSSSVTDSPVFARHTRRPPAAASSVVAPSPSRSTPKEVRELQSASKQLKAEGQDPLAESLRSTQGLSKKRRSREETKEEVVEEDEEEEEEEPNVELEEEDEPAPAPVKTRGRPRKAAKYDREQEDAQKVEADQEMEYQAARDEEDGDEDEEVVNLPKFKGKRPTGAATAGKTPAQLAPATSDPSQRSRPVVHRHAQDRSAKRVPWSSSEIQKLTDGVIEYASERKKWSLILTKYNEFFQDRTVVDLKDKWRNLKGKVGGKAKKGSKVDNAIDEGMEEIED